jgi:hypothetical protein
VKRLVLLVFVLPALSQLLSAQELYVSTEPASNMPRNSVGLRLTTELVPGPDVGVRTMPELMLGISKSLMAHSSLYISDLHQKSQRLEGFGLYAKYRFLSIDTIQRHFRAAAFGRYSSVKNPLHTTMEMPGQTGTLMNVPLDEINLDGDNSGLQGGLVITQLLHKLALSASVSYTRALNNRGGNKLLDTQADESLAYTFSSGLLTYPKTYTSYSQPNINVYMEFLGKSNIGKSQSFMEAAPAVQLILGSRTRLEFSKRFQLYGNMNRMSKNMFLFRIEHNIFNVF